MKVYERFDEIPSMTLQDIKETALIEFTPSPYFFSICPVYINLYTRFDEILL